MEGLGIGRVEGDFGSGGLPVGAEAAEFVGLESYGDLLSLWRGDDDGGLGRAVVVDVDAEEGMGGLEGVLSADPKRGSPSFEETKDGDGWALGATRFGTDESPRCGAAARAFS